MSALTIQEYVGLVVAIIGVLIPVWRLLLKHFIRPLINLLKSHEDLIIGIDTIKKEVTPNGGGSLKDIVNHLKNTCDNIEKRQLVIEQRSRYSLQFHDEILFETDKKGNLVWANERFLNFVNRSIHDLEGYDWISIIVERDRSKFINEFNSCISMCRKFEFFTFSSDMEYVKFSGVPYKVYGDSHEGFLFNLSKIPENENE
jgi:PAS domain-containing protein